MSNLKLTALISLVIGLIFAPAAMAGDPKTDFLKTTELVCAKGFGQVLTIKLLGGADSKTIQGAHMVGNSCASGVKDVLLLQDMGGSPLMMVPHPKPGLLAWNQIETLKKLGARPLIKR